MARGRAAPRRRAQRPLLRVRREGGGLGPEGDGLARRPRRPGRRLRRGRLLGLRVRDPPGPRASRRQPRRRHGRLGTRLGGPPGRRRRTGPALAGPPLRARVPSYVVAQGENAVVVDPHRGLDVYRRLLDGERLRLRAVFDTHLQADHVSGGPALARDAGVAYHASLHDFAGGTLAVEDLADGRAGAGRPARGPAHRRARDAGPHAGQHVAARRRRVPPQRRHALRRRRRTAGPRRPGGPSGAGPPPDAPRAARAAP